jgi:hypothetical protein
VLPDRSIDFFMVAAGLSHPLLKGNVVRRAGVVARSGGPKAVEAAVGEPQVSEAAAALQRRSSSSAR